MGNPQCFDWPSIDEHMLRGGNKLIERQLHRSMRRFQNIDLVDHRRFDAGYAVMNVRVGSDHLVKAQPILQASL